MFLKKYRRYISCDVVHLFIYFFLIELSFDLYLSVVRVSTETTDPTSRNLGGLERNNGDV